MIPVTLTLSGFLSYRAPVTLDFSTFDLACISGQNGAGKSSLLDAITWALFGQARKRDEALVNAASSAAEVALVFQYEGNLYRVQRTLPRGKTSLLEFHIQQGEIQERPSWKPLTERSIRETQARIEQTLRLDYDTFVNASFFLQGKADQFTQQRPGDRKRILGSILGLEIWEAYRARAAERRKGVEGELSALDGRLAEIAAELAEEEPRKAQLEALSRQLDAVQSAREAQEKALDTARRMAAALEEQRKLVDSLARQMESAQRRLADVENRLAQRRAERDSFTHLTGRAAQIRATYQEWQALRAGLEQWETIATQFRQHEKRRQPFLDEINAAGARLVQEQATLRGQQGEVASIQGSLAAIEAQIGAARRALAQAEEQLAQRAALDQQLQEAHIRQAEARAENPRLKAEMDELKTRIDELSRAEGAACPLCGQPLNPDERRTLITGLSAQGKEMGDRYRANQSLLRDADQRVASLQSALAGLQNAEGAARLQAQTLASLTTHHEQARQALSHWAEAGAPRLVEVDAALAEGSYAAEARARLAEVDTELKDTGYDAAAHDAARRRELEGRPAEEELHALERAQATLEPLERELADLDAGLQVQQVELGHLQGDYGAALSAFVAAQSAAPDLYTAERELLNAQEQENRLRMEIGAARQKVAVLADLKARRKALEAQRQTLAQTIGHYKQLERAFGKDGVPALLIEQALPQIESRANDVLERLSGGTMTVRFVTQTAYKDKKREDLKETLDIQISDAVGTREYEMFSGGEAFRVNFAIRLALSEVLAQRAGARLQTLVIDEGFGSQDAQGRQRLVEAINLVKPDFAKILVITHIDELKDAFPTRIEVEKTERGSSLRVV